jgi:hypothetical protein
MMQNHKCNGYEYSATESTSNNNSKKQINGLIKTDSEIYYI